MIMKIEECVRRKVRPKEGDVLIICDELYQVVDSHQDLSSIDFCKKCSLDGKKINNKECIYTFIVSVYKSCAEFFLENTCILKRVNKKFNGI